MVNQYLERAGIDTRIDSRSYKEQGINRIPQIHLGAYAAAMKAKGISTRIGDEYDRIETANNHIRQQLEEIYEGELVIADLDKQIGGLNGEIENLKAEIIEDAIRVKAEAEIAIVAPTLPIITEERSVFGTQRRSGFAASTPTTLPKPLPLKPPPPPEIIVKTPQSKTTPALNSVVSQLTKSLSDYYDIPRTAINEIDLIKIIGEDRLKKVTEYLGKTVPTPGGEDGQIIRSSVRPVEIFIEKVDPYSTSYTFVNLTTNERLNVKCANQSKNIEEISGSISVLIAQQIKGIEDHIAKNLEKIAEITIPEVENLEVVTVEFAAALPDIEKVTANFEVTFPKIGDSEVVITVPIPATPAQNPTDHNEKLHKKAAEKRSDANLWHQGQLAKLDQLPKRSVLNWRGVTENESEAKKAEIDEEYRQRLAHIEQVLGENLKSSLKMSAQEIIDVPSKEKSSQSGTSNGRGFGRD